MRPLEAGAGLSLPSGSDPGAKVFLLPNQLPLFLRVRLGATLLMVAGDPGLSDVKLSDDDRVRSPKNFLTDPGRLLEGLVGEKVLPASLVRDWCKPAPNSSDALPSEEESLCCGAKPGDLGVGCEDRGPFPGVGGRADSTGLSGGAGIEVPSVKEKLTGVSVSGLYENLLVGIMAAGVECANQCVEIGLCLKRSRAEAARGSNWQECKQPGSSGGALGGGGGSRQGLRWRCRD